MSRSGSITMMLCAALLLAGVCDSKKDAVTSGREAIKKVVTQSFDTLEGAKDSLKQSEDKSKTALEEFEKESKP